MNQKAGRPNTTSSPRINSVRVLLSTEELNLLEDLSAATRRNKSDIMREGLELVSVRIKKRELI